MDTINKVYKNKETRLIYKDVPKHYNEENFDIIDCSKLEDEDQELYWLVFCNEILRQSYQEGVLEGISKLIWFIRYNAKDFLNLNNKQLFEVLKYLETNFDYVDCPKTVSGILKETK